jgi:hypothetical protein
MSFHIELIVSIYSFLFNNSNDLPLSDSLLSKLFIILGLLIILIFFLSFFSSRIFFSILEFQSFLIFV